MLSDGRKICEVITFLKEAGVRRVRLMLIVLMVILVASGLTLDYLMKEKLVQLLILKESKKVRVSPDVILVS